MHHVLHESVAIAKHAHTKHSAILLLVAEIIECCSLAVADD